MDFKDIDEIRNEMKRKYGTFYFNNNKLSLNSKNIPNELQHLIPFAEFWGISDDGFREELVEKAPQIALDDLVNIILANEDGLDEWLAGDEADYETPSEEYIAFSAMRMASDFC